MDISEGGGVKVVGIDLIRVLKTLMHYGIVSGIEQRKVSWEYKDQFPQIKDLSL